METRAMGKPDHYSVFWRRPGGEWTKARIVCSKKKPEQGALL